MVEEPPNQSSANEKREAKTDGFERFLNVLVRQVEVVSRHFGYTEEYVLSHTMPWLTRKFEQMQREMFEDHHLKVMQGFQSTMLVLDAVFNKGKEFNNILPPTIEDALKQHQKQREQESQFVTGMWWKKDKNGH